MAKLALDTHQRQSFFLSITAAFSALLLLSLVALLVFIFSRGGAYFWPKNVVELHYFPSPASTPVRLFAEPLPASSSAKWDQMFYYATTPNSPGGSLALTNDQVLKVAYREEIATIHLHSGDILFAELTGLQSPMNRHHGMDDYPLLLNQVEQLSGLIEGIRQQELADIHNALASMNLRGVEERAPGRVKLNKRFFELQGSVDNLSAQLFQYKLLVNTADGNSIALPMDQVRSFYFSNQMSVVDKLFEALSAFLVFVSDSPKQANTAGGVFPALFGTVLMVLLMTVIVTPIGVLAAVYLYEYAPQNKLTSFIRISVNNLAGVPSVVYGVFGLGFFVYMLGGNLDRLLFSDDLPSPVFGAPGLFWASLTMALLTLPVVIVATEEGLRRVPDSLRKASYALGATQAETIWRTVLPIASPGIMTGIILAIARGAGEVAPLMLVGAVKFAPALPIDGQFPFFHPERQFMHLGVLVYDGAFHSENMGPGSSFMFASCMLLLLIVFVLNLLAVILRQRLRRQYGRL